MVLSGYDTVEIEGINNRQSSAVIISAKVLTTPSFLEQIAFFIQTKPEHYRGYVLGAQAFVNTFPPQMYVPPKSPQIKE